MVELDTVKIGVAFGFGVITYDHGNFAGQFAVALPVKQIHQAMVEFRNENANARPMAGDGKAPMHGKFLRNWAKLDRKIFQFQLEISEIPLHAREVKPLFAGLVLLKMQNISIMPKDEIGDSGVQPF